jgi:TonB family protein
MNQSIRIAAAAGALALALSTVVSAATVRLVPLAAQSTAVSRTGCPAESVPASVVAPPVELPEIAVQMKATGVSAIRVDLDSRGTLASAAVLRSSGNRWIDLAALRAARLSAYSAEVRGCERIGGRYALIVDFTE